MALLSMVSSAWARVGITLVATLWLSFGAAPRASDDRGAYAVRGVGLVTCATFSQARANHGDAYVAVAAWVDGYITGINQYAANTYDVAPFESTELFMQVASQYCRDHPQNRIFPVLLDVFKRLWPDRLTHASAKSPIAGAGHTTKLYVAIIERMQRKLQSGGYYKGPVNGEFSAQTVGALKAFQESIAFKPTGFPDQATLWRLLQGKRGSGARTGP